MRLRYLLLANTLHARTWPHALRESHRFRGLRALVLCQSEHSSMNIVIWPTPTFYVWRPGLRPQKISAFRFGF